MPSKDEMTIDERRKYVKLMAERYQQAKRKERSQLLSEMEQVSKLHPLSCNSKIYSLSQKGQLNPLY